MNSIAEVKSDISCQERKIFEDCRSRIIYVLSIHALERFLFFSVIIVLPLNLSSRGVINLSDMGLFYSLLFTSYRGFPVLFGHLSKFFRREAILSVFLVLEAFSLLSMSQTSSVPLMYILAVVIGVSGGATTPMILSLLEEDDKKCKDIISNGIDHDIFNIHFMLINAAAFSTPFLAFLSDSIYKNVIILIFVVLMSLFLLFFFKILKNQFKQDVLKIVTKKESGFDVDFLCIWIASVSVWAACSTIYAIIPSLDSDFFGRKGVNLWLSIDALAVVVFYFIFKYFSLFTSNSVKNTIIGMGIITIGLLVILLLPNDFILCAVAIVVLSFGGYIAFPQLYSLAMKTRFKDRKTVYLGFMAFSGAVGEGGMQTIFWLTESAKVSLISSVGILFLGMVILQKIKLTPQSV